jgi:lipoate-protein ligase A
MHVRRGRAPTVPADQGVTEAVVSYAQREREPALRVWTPHRQVAFGRRDRHSEGYDRACEAAEARGFESTTRDVGGRAVAFSGTTLAVVHAVPVDDPRSGLQTRYEAAVERLARALETVGVSAVEGEPPDSFCPGTHSLRAGGGKVVGVAQRVRADVAVVAGVVVVADRDAVADVLAAVYDLLGVPFDPASVGSVAAAGGPADPEIVGDAVERVFRD